MAKKTHPVAAAAEAAAAPASEPQNAPATAETAAPKTDAPAAPADVVLQPDPVVIETSVPAANDPIAEGTNGPPSADGHLAAFVEARVLCDQGEWKANDVALLTPAEAAAAEAAGWADPHPDAVAYAKATRDSAV